MVDEEEFEKWEKHGDRVIGMLDDLDICGCDCVSCRRRRAEKDTKK